MKKPQKVEMNTVEVRDKLAEQLKTTGWYDLLRGFIMSDDFLFIINELKEQVEEGYRFTPSLKNLFRPFIECPFKDLKVVFINDTPYSTLGVADGLAFSSKDSEMREQELVMIHNAINKTVYQSKDYKPSKDLTGWANQGVLLLNASMTTKIDRANSHLKLWNPFITYVVDMLNTKSDCKASVLFGRNASHYSDLLENTEIFEVQGLWETRYADEKEWDCNDVFNKVNGVLKAHDLPVIVW
jgi:uracil-DNA glycosylase